jgi:elongation factor Ts
MVEVNAETDFVAKNASFREFVQGVLRTIVAKKPATNEELMALPFDGGEMTVEGALKDKIFTIGENMSIRRFVIVEGACGSYIHGNGAIACVTKFDTENVDVNSEAFAEFAKNICMQIVAMTPAYVCRHCVPESVLANEKEIALTQINNDPKNASKPENIKEKMIEGRINKFFESACLVDQGYVKEDKITVGQYTENTAKELGGSIKINSFVKFERGEGLEKKEEDFASEIEKLVNG